MGRPYSVSTDRVAAHAAALIRDGATCHGIATAANTSPTSLQKILDGEQLTMWATTAARLLAVTLADALDDYQLRVDAMIATRRVRALIALGHTVTDIRAACTPPVDRNTMSGLINGSLPRIRARTDSAVTAAYAQLSPLRGSSVLSLNRGATNGWLTPEQWDGEIDNADADPAQWARDGIRDVAALVEDAEWLHNEIGDSWEAIAFRFGMRVNALHQYRTRVRRAQEAT